MRITLEKKVDFIETNKLVIENPTDSKSLPIGTILSIVGDINVKHLMLCDGRSCLNTDFNILTGYTNTPDLRGQYLSGSSETRLLGTFETFKTGPPKTPFKISLSSSGSHYHAGQTNIESNHFHNYEDINILDRSLTGIFTENPNTLGKNRTISTNLAGSHSHNFTTNSAGYHSHDITQGGDSETCPRSYTTNYYIKVNVK